MTDWEKRYREGDTPWERGAPSPGLLDFLKTRPLTGEVLAPGCGFGHDVRAISNADNRVVGLDIAPSAIARAKSFPAAAGESYLVGDLFNLPRDFRSRFDWIWEHTCFCTIEPARRQAYVDAVSSALKPGGHLLGVFFNDADDEKGPPHGIAPADLDRLFAPAFDLENAWSPRLTFEGREGCEIMRLWRRR